RDRVEGRRQLVAPPWENLSVVVEEQQEAPPGLPGAAIRAPDEALVPIVPNDQQSLDLPEGVGRQLRRRVVDDDDLDGCRRSMPGDGCQAATRALRLPVHRND